MKNPGEFDQRFHIASPHNWISMDFWVQELRQLQQNHLLVALFRDMNGRWGVVLWWNSSAPKNRLSTITTGKTGRGNSYQVLPASRRCMGWNFSFSPGREGSQCISRNHHQGWEKDRIFFCFRWMHREWFLDACLLEPVEMFGIIRGAIEDEAWRCFCFTRALQPSDTVHYGWFDAEGQELDESSMARNPRAGV